MNQRYMKKKLAISFLPVFKVETKLEKLIDLQSAEILVIYPKYKIIFGAISND